MTIKNTRFPFLFYHLRGGRTVPEDLPRMQRMTRMKLADTFLTGPRRSRSFKT